MSFCMFLKSTMIEDEQMKEERECKTLLCIL